MANRVNNLSKRFAGRLGAGVVIVVILLAPMQAAALSQAQKNIFDSGIYYFDAEGGTNGSCTSILPSDNTGGSVATTATQNQNAQTIIGIAKSDGLGENAALIGLMVGIDESHLSNLANENVPLSEQNPNKQGDGSNGYSLGVFQQQITEGWSTISNDVNNTDAINQLMTPAYAAEAFFGSPSGSNAPSALSKGLQNVANWQTMEPWAAAQGVQHSSTADGSNYEQFVNQAQSLLNQFWSSTAATALPVLLTGGDTATNNGNSTTGTSSDCSSGSSGCSLSGSTAPANLSQLRQQIVCVAEQELQLWHSGQLKPGANAYFKYSQNRSEEWCADFVSWLFNQAGYPLGPAGSYSNDWDVPYVPNLIVPPQDSSKFTYHSVDSGYTPQPGDIAIHGSQHTNIVVSVNGSTVTLIGGDQGGDSYPTNIVSEYSITSPGSDDPPITGYVSPNQ